MSLKVRNYSVNKPPANLHSALDNILSGGQKRYGISISVAPNENVPLGKMSYSTIAISSYVRTKSAAVTEKTSENYTGNVYLRCRIAERWRDHLSNDILLVDKKKCSFKENVA